MNAPRTTTARTTTVRIIDHAIGLLRIGIPPIEAIEIACDRIATCPVARERARGIYLTLLAKLEREAADTAA